MTILKPRIETSTKVLGLRIPAALHAEYEQIRKAADQAGMVFSVKPVVNGIACPHHAAGAGRTTADANCVFP